VARHAVTSQRRSAAKFENGNVKVRDKGSGEDAGPQLREIARLMRRKSHNATTDAAPMNG